MTTQLHPDDLRRVVGRIPKDISTLLADRRLFIGGGFLRSIIGGETPNDIDIFGDTATNLRAACDELAKGREGSRMHKTDNALTLLCPPRVPVQFITRWMYSDAQKLIASFDFTICQSTVWRDHGSAKWMSMIGPDFYHDLAARRLRYTSPMREEAPGGSMMRVAKFLARGYHISPESLGRVIDRLVSGVKPEALHGMDQATAIVGLLREVDPLRVIDGIETEAVDPDHQPEIP